MSIPAAADRRQLLAELRSLAGDTRAAIDALVASWYLEFRVRTSRTYSQWIDPARREIAAALVFGADARPGCARLGARRALAGFGEAEVRDDLASLAQVVATDPTLEPPPFGDLLAVTLAGWHAASGSRARPATPVVDPPGAAHLGRLLGRVAAEDADPVPVVAVVDVGAAGVGGTVRSVAPVLDRIEAAGPGPIGVGWFELAGGSRYASVTRRTCGTARALAVLRGALRVAPELAGRPVHVWIEPVPRAPAALPAFVRGLTGGAQPRLHPPVVRPRRLHRGVTRPARGRGRSHARPSRSPRLPERWLASAAALVLVVMAVGTFGVEPHPDGRRDGAGGDDAPTTPRSPAAGAETGADTVAVPPVSAASGVAVGDEPAPEPSVAIEPTPVAHVEPVEAVEPAPDDPPSTEPPTPAPASPPPPSAPGTAPAPGSPEPGTSVDEPAPTPPGPPAHVSSKIPDHAASKAAEHASPRARITRM